MNIFSSSRSFAGGLNIEVGVYMHISLPAKVVVFIYLGVIIHARIDSFIAQQSSCYHISNNVATWTSNLYSLSMNEHDCQR